MTVLTKEELRRLRKATEGRDYMTKQLYDTLQKVFKWLDEVIPVGFFIHFKPKSEQNYYPQHHYRIAKKLDPLTYVTDWYFADTKITLDYDAWKNINPLDNKLSRDDILFLSKNLDVIIKAIKDKMNADTQELQETLNFVQETVFKEANQ